MQLTSKFITLSLVLGLLALAGCSNDETASLKLVPVQGKLKEQGGKSVSAGRLEFAPSGDSIVGAAIADVGPDGSFTVQTVSKKKPRDGMVPGRYTVTYFPPSIQDQMPDPVTLEGELVVPDAGIPDLKIEIPAQRRK